MLNYFKKVVQLRKDNPVLVYGKYTLLDKDNPDIYAYTRELAGKKMLIMLSFSTRAAEVKTGIDTKSAKLLLSNYANPSSSHMLQPYEAAIYELP